jgi:hypothetical protein
VSAASKTYSRRLFLTYQEVIEGRGKDVDRAVAEFAAANRSIDLEQQLTFRQWFAEIAQPPSAHSRKRTL